MAVWTFPPAPGGFTATHNSQLVVHNLGDGIVRSVSRSLPWTKQDGTGGSDRSFSGWRTFSITLPVQSLSATFEIIDFLQARLDAGVESFYLYDPSVTPDPDDWDGSTTAGRHLVRHLEATWSVSVENLGLSRFGELTFQEVQS